MSWQCSNSPIFHLKFLFLPFLTIKGHSSNHDQFAFLQSVSPQKGKQKCERQTARITKRLLQLILIEVIIDI